MEEFVFIAIIETYGQIKNILMSTSKRISLSLSNKLILDCIYKNNIDTRVERLINLLTIRTCEIEEFDKKYKIHGQYIINVDNSVNTITNVKDDHKNYWEYQSKIKYSILSNNSDDRIINFQYVQCNFIFNNLKFNKFLDNNKKFAEWIIDLLDDPDNRSKTDTSDVKKVINGKYKELDQVFKLYMSESIVDLKRPNKKDKRPNKKGDFIVKRKHSSKKEDYINFDIKKYCINVNTILSNKKITFIQCSNSPNQNIDLKFFGANDEITLNKLFNEMQPTIIYIIFTFDTYFDKYKNMIDSHFIKTVNGFKQIQLIHHPDNELYRKGDLNYIL